MLTFEPDQNEMLFIELHLHHPQVCACEPAVASLNWNWNWNWKPSREGFKAMEQILDDGVKIETRPNAVTNLR